MKGVFYLFDVIVELFVESLVCFLFIGCGLDSVEMLKVMEQKGISDWIVFVGFCKDVLELVKVCDLSLLFLVKGEGLFKVLLESFFFGNFIIMMDIGGNWGLVIYGEMGLVIFLCDFKVMVDVI